MHHIVDLTPSVLKELRRPFPPQAIKFVITATNRDKTKALVAFHLDARQVSARLDQVVGPGNWYDRYVELADDGKYAAIECSLTVCGITKVDVGDGTDALRFKGGYSDALKRAAVKFGIGHLNYLVPNLWTPIKDGKYISDESAVRAHYEKFITNAKVLAVFGEPLAMGSDQFEAEAPPAEAVEAAPEPAAAPEPTPEPTPEPEQPAPAAEAEPVEPTTNGDPLAALVDEMVEWAIKASGQDEKTVRGAVEDRRKELGEAFTIDYVAGKIAELKVKASA